jgi:hypothetical protein
MNPVYGEQIIIENKQKVLYVHITKAIYGLLAMIFYRSLIGYGFTINPYDP